MISIIHNVNKYIYIILRHASIYIILQYDSIYIIFLLLNGISVLLSNN